MAKDHATNNTKSNLSYWKSIVESFTTPWCRSYFWSSQYNDRHKPTCSSGRGSFSHSANQRSVITPRGDLITRYHLTSHLSLDLSLITWTLNPENNWQRKRDSVEERTRVKEQDKKRMANEAQKRNTEHESDCRTKVTVQKMRAKLWKKAGSSTVGATACFSKSIVRSQTESSAVVHSRTASIHGTITTRSSTSLFSWATGTRENSWLLLEKSLSINLTRKNLLTFSIAW